VPIYNLMEDAATAEISPAQVWQSSSGDAVTRTMVRELWDRRSVCVACQPVLQRRIDRPPKAMACPTGWTGPAPPQHTSNMGPISGLNPIIAQLRDRLAFRRMECGMRKKLSISPKKVRRILQSAGVSERQHV
jgi:hypothetical protein